MRLSVKYYIKHISTCLKTQQEKKRIHVSVWNFGLLPGCTAPIIPISTRDPSSPRWWQREKNYVITRSSAANWPLVVSLYFHILVTVFLLITSDCLFLNLHDFYSFFLSFSPIQLSNLHSIFHQLQESHQVKPHGPSLLPHSWGSFPWWVAYPKVKAGSRIQHPTKVEHPCSWRQCHTRQAQNLGRFSGGC